MSVLFRVWIVFMLSSFAMAEEELDWELDWELDFEIKQKSTLSDFPLKEIGQEELSNAAIAGALQKNQTIQQESTSGKPAYQQEQEASNKNNVERVEKRQLDENIDATTFLQNLPEIPPSIDFQPETYKIPDGRTYEHWENHTVDVRE